MKQLEHITPTIGISACLLGDLVRYDGAHRRNSWLVEHLGPSVTWVKVCPEVEIGLGVPRERIRLVHLGASTRLVGEQSGTDLTDAMARLAASRFAELDSAPLDGYILKTRSPSCGLTNVKRFGSQDASAPLDRGGRGRFAVALVERFPGLPVIEDHELEHDSGRSRFVDAVVAYWGTHGSGA